MICTFHKIEKKSYTNKKNYTNKYGDIITRQYEYEYCPKCALENKKKNPNTPQNNKRHRDNIRFDGKREIVINRDKNMCVQCGMTREEHYKKWLRDITVDHIDGLGINSEVKNNSLDNLQTLCLSCHGIKDYKRRKDYECY